MSSSKAREKRKREIGDRGKPLSVINDDEVNNKENIDDEENGHMRKKRQEEGEEREKNVEEKELKDILGNVVKYSKTTKEIFMFHKKQYPEDDLIDLRLSSPFFKNLPKSIASNYLTEMDKMTEQLIPKKVHEFLVQFFSQKIPDTEWQTKIDDIQSPEPDNPLMIAVVRILHHTLPQFIKAFSLGSQNPLQNISTIEQAHLNAFVHPCLDSTLWNLAKVHYEYGEIPSKNHYKKNRADGVGFMTDADKFQLVYVEGSRPVVKQEKEIKDVKKIINNLKSIFSKIIKEIVKDRRCLPKKLFVFGGQSFRLRIYLYYLDYCGNYRLNEVDNASLPREFSEMQDFVYFYESILKWALLVWEVKSSFDEAKTKPRLSRFSYVDALLRLDE